MVAVQLPVTATVMDRYSLAPWSLGGSVSSWAVVALAGVASIAPASIVPVSTASARPMCLVICVPSVIGSNAKPQYQTRSVYIMDTGLCSAHGASVTRWVDTASPHSLCQTEPSGRSPGVIGSMLIGSHPAVAVPPGGGTPGWDSRSAVIDKSRCISVDLDDDVRIALSCVLCGHDFIALFSFHKSQS